MAWYNAGWQFRAKVTSQASQVNAAYPYCLAIDLGSHFSGVTDFWNNVQSSGADIRVTKADETTEVARGVRGVSVSSEAGVVYVHHPDISASSDVDLYIYWGNSGAADYADDATYGMQATWASESVLLHLTLDDEDIAADQSGNDNDGAVQNTPTSTAGKVGKARSFQKSEPDWISVPHSTDFEGLTALTVLAWCKPSATNHGGFFARVVSKPNTATSDDFFLGYLPVGGGNYSGAFRITTGGFVGTSIEASSTMTTGAWNHLAGTWNGSVRKIYVNAVERKSESATGSLQQSSQPFGIGSHPNNAVSNSNRSVEGEEDQIVVIGRTLSSDEISTRFNCENANDNFWVRDVVETQSGAFINPPTKAADATIIAPSIASGGSVVVPTIAAAATAIAPQIVTTTNEIVIPTLTAEASLTSPQVIVQTPGVPRDRRRPWQKLNKPIARMPARLRR